MGIQIDFETAKNTAERLMKENFSLCGVKFSDEALCESYLDKEFCYIFFRNKSILIPHKFSMNLNWAYAVCKRTGEYQQIYDLRNNPSEMEKYSELISELFAHDRKQTRQLYAKMELHLKKYGYR